MFELGLRLAFDKPVIIVKDDRTGYSFDTGPIEHLTYPRDLRFAKIVEFQKLLAAKVLSTLRKSKENPNYSPFLKAFGEFSLPKVAHKEVGAQEFIMQQLDSINLALSRLTRDARRMPPSTVYPRLSGDADICGGRWGSERNSETVRSLQKLEFVDSTKRYLLEEDHEHIAVFFKHPLNESEELKLKEIAPRVRIRKKA